MSLLLALIGAGSSGTAAAAPLAAAGVGALLFSGATGAAVAPLAAGATGEEVFSGAGSAAVAPAAADSAGSLAFTGTAGAALGPLAAAATGALAFSGDGSAAAAPLSVAGIGALAFVGTGTGALAPVAAAGTGDLAFVGVGSVAVAALTADGTALVPFSGEGLAALAPLAAVSVGAQTFTGTASAALPTAGADGTGAQVFSGTGSAAFAPPAATGSGLWFIVPRQGQFGATVARAVVRVSLSGATAEAALAPAPRALVSLAAPLVTVTHQRVAVGVTAVSFVIKAGDTIPTLRATLTYNGAAYDLSLATGVTLRYRRDGATGSATERAATVISASGGIVEYAFVTGDLTAAGTYLCDWEVALPGSARITFPNSGHATFEVTSEL